MRDASLARAIAEGLGARVNRVREIVGKGVVNHVFVAETSEGPWVVRFSRDPLDTDDFAKEAWCLSAVPRFGVPTPQLVARGATEEVLWIVQTFVPGRSHALGLWPTLGRYARLLAGVPLDDAPDSLFPRFGRDPALNWTRHLDYNLGQLGGDDPLVALGVYDSDGPLRAAFERLRELKRFGLSHGDLAPGNVILSEGVPVLIDWGSATTGPVPYSDLLNVLADERFSEDDAREFARGMEVDLDAALPTLRNLKLLGAIDVVRWAIDRRPDRIESYGIRAREVIREGLGPSNREAS